MEAPLAEHLQRHLEQLLAAAGGGEPGRRGGRQVRPIAARCVGRPDRQETDAADGETRRCDRPVRTPPPPPAGPPEPFRPAARPAGRGVTLLAAQARRRRYRGAFRVPVSRRAAQCVWLMRLRATSPASMARERLVDAVDADLAGDQLLELELPVLVELRSASARPRARSTSRTSSPSPSWPGSRNVKNGGRSSMTSMRGTPTRIASPPLRVMLMVCSIVALEADDLEGHVGAAAAGERHAPWRPGRPRRP